MAAGPKFYLKIFSPRIVMKAMVSLDKSTAVIISACWLAALVTLILAVFAIHGAVSTKKEAADALAIEPVLPKADTSAISVREVQSIMDRLQHQFPEIKFEPGANESIVVKSSDGSKFHQWVSALTYIDTMAPQYRWTLPEFCVGSCSSQDLMRAVVQGQRVVFSLPQP